MDITKQLTEELKMMKTAQNLLGLLGIFTVGTGLASVRKQLKKQSAKCAFYDCGDDDGPILLDDTVLIE